MLPGIDFRYTLCFITSGDHVLMLLRNKMPNQGLWNGVGGRLEPGETPKAGVLREILEETGFSFNDARFAGLLTWEGFEISNGGLYIFTAEIFPEVEPKVCSEGILAWKHRHWVLTDHAVVSNIHVFGPAVFNHTLPQRHHFVYQSGEIVQYQASPLSAGFDVG
jgi:8-oxo-dGTP diphosphatase